MSVIDETYRVAWGDLVYMKGNLIEVLLSSLVGPLLYLLAFGFGVGGSMEDPAGYVKYIIPGIIAMTTLSATFSTVSMKILVQRLFYMSFDELLLCPLHISAII
ncbi:MAG: ABC transporter, partial [Candidatus Methanomethylophilaceae archaeon]|nr:ABC transporter [Candidatus Methanomethylophilaceae archaeon]